MSKDTLVKKLLAIAVLLPIIALIGCKATTTDEQSIQDLVSSMAWFNSPSTQTDVDTAISTPSKAKGDTVLVGWWRVITEFTKDINVQVSGDSAYVLVTRHSTGRFNVVERDTATHTWIKNVKPLAETAQIQAIFLRTGDKNDHKGWRLRVLKGKGAISGAVGSSDSICTVKIDSVRIQCTSYPDTVLTNPYNTLFDTANVLKFSSAESVAVTLYAQPNGEAFLHRYFVGGVHIRRPMHNNGDGTYTISFWSNVIPGLRFVTFDLINHNTIYDASYPYDCNYWQYPYVVKVK